MVLVDTPGFHDTYVDDVDVLHNIGSWLETMYDSRDSHGYKGATKLAGIVYFHDISLTRMLGSTLKDLDVFQKLCRKDALKHVVLCTTSWKEVYQEEGEKRIEQLREICWKTMAAGGSTIHQFEDSQKSAWDVIAPIIEEDLSRCKKMDSLQIQEELVDVMKLLPDDEAGRHLRYDLDQLLKSLKQAYSKDSSWREVLDAKIASICDRMRAMCITSGTQDILGLLDLGVDKILYKFMFMKSTPPNKLLGKFFNVSADE